MNRKFIRPNFTFLLILLFLSNVIARADKVDDYMRRQLAERNIPGAAIAIIKNGQAIRTAGYGLSSVEFNAPVSKETVFEIGSISKQMTAAAIMLLVEEGKVNLEEKISRYLPSTPDEWKNVTVRHLLTHTSGIKSYSSLSGFELTKRLKRDEFVKSLGVHPLEFEPGARWNYSNSGYNLLGFIIESVAQKSYWDFMHERIFKPLGMNHTTDRDPKNIISNRATGYEWENGKLIGRDYDLTDVFSAGAIVSTILDLAKWDAVLRNDTFLKKESKALIWTPVILNDGKPYPYGLGWNVTDFRGHKLYSHGGQTAGFAANISRYVDDNLTVIVLTNLGDLGLGGMISKGIAKIYMPGISLAALKGKAEQPEAEVTKTLETALRDYLEGKVSGEFLSEEMKRSLSTVRAKAAAKRIASFGAIKKFVFIESEISDASRIYRYRAEMPNRIFLWRFTVNNNGKISGISLEEEE